jgi:hypothetical protein
MTDHDVATRFADAMAGGDVEVGIGLLAPDVVFHSPVVHRPYEGREAVAAILRAVSVVFEDFSYAERYDAPGGHVLAFNARVGDRRDGAALLRRNRAPGAHGRRPGGVRRAVVRGSVRGGTCVQQTVVPEDSASDSSAQRLCVSHCC